MGLQIYSFKTPFGVKLLLVLPEKQSILLLFFLENITKFLLKYTIGIYECPGEIILFTGNLLVHNYEY